MGAWTKRIGRLGDCWAKGERAISGRPWAKPLTFQRPPLCSRPPGAWAIAPGVKWAMGRTKTGRTKTGRTKTGRTKTGRTKTGRTKTGELYRGEGAIRDERLRLPADDTGQGVGI